MTRALVFIAITVLLDVIGFGLILPVLAALLMSLAGRRVVHAGLRLCRRREPTRAARAEFRRARRGVWPGIHSGPGARRPAGRAGAARAVLRRRRPEPGQLRVRFPGASGDARDHAAATLRLEAREPARHTDPDAPASGGPRAPRGTAPLDARAAGDARDLVFLHDVPLRLVGTRDRGLPRARGPHHG